MKKVADLTEQNTILQKKASDGKWQRIKYMPCTGIGENGSRVTECAGHIALARKAAAEGIVLLKNDENILPLKKGQKVAVFGKAQADYVKGGGGSGDVNCSYVRSVLEGLQIKAEEGKVELFSPLSAYYSDYISLQAKDGVQPGFAAEPDLPAGLADAAAEFTDTAIITVCRYSSEGYDRTGEKYDGDFYLSRGEESMVSAVTERFENVIVVLNTGAVMDTTWFSGNPKINSALIVWQGGMEGGLAAADVLCGDVNPSGHLADTIAGSFGDYPSSATYNDSDEYTEYLEDIFVGYRYFETVPGASEKVVYPFGFGLSYTSFSIDGVEARPTLDGDFMFAVTVRNTGEVSGRQVVQIYCEAPQGKLGKAKRVLVGFRKTGSILPGESETVYIHVERYFMASYDDTGLVRKSAYVLEKGEYIFHIGFNVRDTVDAECRYVIDDDIILEQLSEKCAPRQLTARMLPDGSLAPVAHEDSVPRPDDNFSLLPFDGQAPRENLWERTSIAWVPETGPSLEDVYRGKMTLDDFTGLLSVEQKVSLLGGQPNRGPCNTFGFGNIQQFGIPNVMTADGTPGLRFWKETGINTTAFPVATLMACTWDYELMHDVEYAIGREVRENGIGVLLAPAVNIHRNPLCGRNFEYYSEDPYLTGIMAAEAVRGIQENGIAASLKHFACNNRETNRRENDSRLSERALREIYLKAFEICVKYEFQPLTIMSSYNIVNGVRASENRELLTDILRGEWGYKGLVETDWYTHGEQWKEIAAGNDVKMGRGMPEHTLEMIREGKLGMEYVDESVRRLLELLLKLA